MNKLELLKSAAELIVSIGVSSVVGNAIKASLPENTKVVRKVAVGIGGFVLSSMVGDMASKYATESIDEMAVKLTSVVKSTKKLGDAVKDSVV